MHNEDIEIPPLQIYFSYLNQEIGPEQIDKPSDSKEPSAGVKN